MRRPEIVTLSIADVKFVQCGVRIQIAASKDDQTGVGRADLNSERKLIRPVNHLEEWTDRLGEHEARSSAASTSAAS